MITLVSISLKDPLTDHLHISLGETNIMPHVDQDSVQLLQNLQLSVAQVTMEFQAVMETLKGKKKGYLLPRTCGRSKGDKLHSNMDTWCSLPNLQFR